MNITIANRDVRQRELIPPDRLDKVNVTVVGVGAIGRQLALQLAAIGTPKITIVDFDNVEAENLSAQGFLESDLGNSKVSSVANMCQNINSEIEIISLNGKFRTIGFADDVLFCCVDSIDTRKIIFNALKNRVELFVDGRMSAEYLRVISAFDDKSREYYSTTLFSSGEAYRGSCTSKSTIYTANIAAGIMVSQFTKWLRDIPIDKDIDLNILTNEMGAK